MLRFGLNHRRTCCTRSYEWRTLFAGQIRLERLNTGEPHFLTPENAGAVPIRFMDSFKKIPPLSPWSRERVSAGEGSNGTNDGRSVRALKNSGMLNASTILEGFAMKRSILSVPVVMVLVGLASLAPGTRLQAQEPMPQITGSVWEGTENRDGTPGRLILGASGTHFSYRLRNNKTNPGPTITSCHAVWQQGPVFPIPGRLCKPPSRCPCPFGLRNRFLCLGPSRAP